jgi:hypothetical protein
MTTILSALDGIRGCKVAHIVAFNAPVKLKKGHGFAHPVRCLTVKRVLIAVAYKWMVDAQCMAEGLGDANGNPVTINPLPTWGEYKRRVDGSELPYMEHDGPEGPYYLPNMPVEYLHTEYRLMDGSSPMGSIVPYATVAPFLPTRSEGSRQPNAKKIPWRKNGLRNVIRVVIGETIAEGQATAILTAMLKGEQATVKEIAGKFAPAFRVEEIAGLTE